jgi:hypothetical protein
MYQERQMQQQLGQERRRQYLRKRDVAHRYSMHPRSVERAAASGRIPLPEYPLGPARPLWDLEKLEANERAAVKRSANSGDAA